jgi:hypothetical protein
MDAPTETREDTRMGTTVLPEVKKTPIGYFKDKGAVGACITATSVVVGTLSVGLLATEINDPAFGPGEQKIVAGVVATAVAAILSGAWNWFKHKFMG